MLSLGEVVVSYLLQDSWEGSLDKRTGVELNHAMFVDVFNHLVKVTMVVIDNVPAESPSWQAIDL